LPNKEQQREATSRSSRNIAGIRFTRVGVCLSTGKSFGELIHHFIVGGDEKNMMASEDNQSLGVVGLDGHKKHEKKMVDCMASISMHHTDSAAGDIGPNMFLLKGKNRRSGYTDAFL
jgi:hypothetical protein